MATNRAVLGLVLLVVAPTSAHSLTGYTDRSLWQDALSGSPIFNEDFETAIPPSPVIDHGEVVLLSNGASMIGIGSGGLAFFRDGGFPPAFPTRHLETDFERTTTKLVFQFDHPIVGFGFDYAEAELAGSVWISIPDVGSFGAPISPSSTVASFAGIVLDRPITQFSIATAANDDQYYVDDLTFAFVPEPGKGVLVASVLLLLTAMPRPV